MTRFSISATGFTLNYLPEYIADREGFFETEGLEVERQVPTPWTLVLDDLNEGRADAALGGIWVPSMYRGRGARYMAWAQVSSRCPLALLRRSGTPEFNLELLHGSTVLVTGGNGSSPFMYLRLFLEEQGADLSDITFVHDLATPMLTELFLGGMGDFLVVDTISAEIAASKDAGVDVALYLAEVGGRVPWSVYYSPENSAGLGQLPPAFARALRKAVDYITDVEIDKIKPVLEELFPSAPGEILAMTFRRYREWGMWEGPGIDEDALARWQGAICRSGLVDRALAAHEIVDAKVTEGANVATK